MPMAPSTPKGEPREAGGVALGDHEHAGRDVERRRRGPRERTCCCCKRAVPFCWRCRCGLCVCAECMAENLWGLSCNQITWQCPDCGAWHGFGNG
jgi:hypothetical protein